MHDACRCLPSEKYLEGKVCYLYYATDPNRKIKVHGSAALAKVRAETQKMQNILSEAFLTQRASNETMMGWQNKTNIGMRMVHEARQKVLLSLVAQRSRVYACHFKHKQFVPILTKDGILNHSRDGNEEKDCWCIGIA